MDLFGFFRKKHSVPCVALKEAVPHKSEARDAFYADLMAQERARQEALMNKNADDILFGGSDELTDAQRLEIAKELVKVNPKPTISVKVETENGLVDAEDEYPTGYVMSGGGDDGRFADLWKTYAAINPRILKHFISRIFIGYPACELLGSHEIINPCCAMPGEDAMSTGYTLKCVSTEHRQNDKHIMSEEDWLSELVTISDRMGIRKNCTDLSFYTRLYGIGVAVPRVELVDGHTMEEPYDPSLVKKGSYKGFSVVDPQDFVWDYDSMTLFNPLSEWYMRPEYLRLISADSSGAGWRIHRSWCVVCLYKEVGTRLRATYMWGGVPLSQMLYERVFCADKLANEIVALAMSKRTVVKDGNMESMIAEPGKTNHFIQRWNGFRSNSAIAFKEPGEQIQQLETSLADLQPLSAQQYQYAAAIAGIPVTKLLKNVPSGLQATGQYEQDEYDQTLTGIQNAYFKPLLMMHYELFIKSNYPERDDLKVDVIFNPLHSPKVAEVQQIASQKGSMVCSLLQQSAITVTEARAILKGCDSPVFAHISSETPELLTKIEKLKDPEEQQKLQLEMQQKMMAAQGGAGGMAGGMGGIGGMGPQAQQQDPRARQQFEENKNVFQDALKEVLGDEGGNDQSAESAERPENDGPFEQAQKEIAEST